MAPLILMSKPQRRTGICIVVLQPTAACLNRSPAATRVTTLTVTLSAVLGDYSLATSPRVPQSATKSQTVRDS
ncbi:hypothetical protein CPAR01_14687 [Colletotrichum paranaense]|uniref:Secreted protein n=1 Tax=Colletotrichum paranaense TaxID=1914294 RepID=A0ABQ9S167_9PEZI|nr:uncharacterized protein CPAR01_14687 [Colletotrichum paranaense]KAK1521770.1 hypothetical protein CPAR01_14687 [Colletotrichum paranaense]